MRGVFQSLRTKILASTVFGLCLLFSTLNFAAHASKKGAKPTLGEEAKAAIEKACAPKLINAPATKNQVSLEEVLKTVKFEEANWTRSFGGELPYYSPSSWRYARSGKRGVMVLMMRVGLINGLAKFLDSSDLSIHPGQYGCLVAKYRAMERASSRWGKGKYREMNQMLKVIEANKLHTAAPKWKTTYQDFMKELDWFVLRTHQKRSAWAFSNARKISDSTFINIRYPDYAYGNQNYVHQEYGGLILVDYVRRFTPMSLSLTKSKFKSGYAAMGKSLADRKSKKESRKDSVQRQSKATEKRIDQAIEKSKELAKKAASQPKRRDMHNDLKTISPGFRWWFDNQTGELVSKKYPRGFGDMELGVRGQEGTHYLQGVRFLGGELTWGLAGDTVVRVGRRPPYGAGLVFSQFQYTLSENGNSVDLNDFIWVPAQYEQKGLSPEEASELLSAGPSGRGYIVYWNGTVKYGTFSSKEVGAQTVYTFEQTDDAKKSPPPAPEDILSAAERKKLETQYRKR